MEGGRDLVVVGHVVEEDVTDEGRIRNEVRPLEADCRRLQKDAFSAASPIARSRARSSDGSDAVMRSS